MKVLKRFIKLQNPTPHDSFQCGAGEEVKWNRLCGKASRGCWRFLFWILFTVWVSCNWLLINMVLCVERACIKTMIWKKKTIRSFKIFLNRRTRDSFEVTRFFVFTDTNLKGKTKYKSLHTVKHYIAIPLCDSGLVAIWTKIRNVKLSSPGGLEPPTFRLPKLR